MAGAPEPGEYLIGSDFQTIVKLLSSLFHSNLTMKMPMFDSKLKQIRVGIFRSFLNPLSLWCKNSAYRTIKVVAVGGLEPIPIGLRLHLPARFNSERHLFVTRKS